VVGSTTRHGKNELGGAVYGFASTGGRNKKQLGVQKMFAQTAQIHWGKKNNQTLKKKKKI